VKNKEEVQMNAHSRAVLWFSAGFAVFFMAPAFLSMPFGAYPLMSWGDVFDILTPLALLPLYWNLFRLADQDDFNFRAGLPFLIAASLWVEGQRMHLAANSIGHLLKGLENSPAYELTVFYDELLSHYLWHLGVIGLVALIVLRQWNAKQAGAKISRGILIFSWVLYGFTFSAILLEAKTTALGIPFLLILVGIILLWGRVKLKIQPLLNFFFGASVFSLVLLSAWWLYWGELLEPSKWLNF
jgi:hypothetical protein